MSVFSVIRVLYYDVSCASYNDCQISEVKGRQNVIVFRVNQFSALGR